MDKIIECHTEERMFIGGKPDTILDSYKKMSIMMGASPESFTAGKIKLSKNGPRSLEESTTVAKFFRKHYIHGGLLDISVGNVSQLLNDLAQSEISNKSKRELSRGLKRKWTTAQTLSPLQLLAALRERMIDEEPRLIFNYFGMHQRCVELMRLIRTEIHSNLVQYFGEKYLESEYQLSTVILYIFHVALGPGMGARAYGIAPLAGSGAKTGSLLMQRAGKVMQDFLRNDGGIACKELRAFCKNEKHTQEEAREEGNRRDKNMLYWFTMEDMLTPAQMASLQTGIRT